MRRKNLKESCTESLKGSKDTIVKKRSKKSENPESRLFSEFNKDCKESMKVEINKGKSCTERKERKASKAITESKERKSSKKAKISDIVKVSKKDSSIIKNHISVDRNKSIKHNSSTECMGDAKGKHNSSTESTSVEILGSVITSKFVGYCPKCSGMISSLDLNSSRTIYTCISCGSEGNSDNILASLNKVYRPKSKKEFLNDIISLSEEDDS